MPYPSDLRQQLTELTYAAFAEKFTHLFGSPPAAKAVLSRSLNPQQALLDIQDGHLRGLLGYFDVNGSYLAFSRQTLRRLLPPQQFRQACAGLALLASTCERTTLYIEALAVAADCRHQGVASGLLTEAKAYARSLGYQRLALDVACTNTAARALYAKHGFGLHHQRSLDSTAFGFSHFDQMCIRDSCCPD